MIYDHPVVAGLYARSPTVVQDAMVSGYGILKRRERRGRVFQSYFRELDASQWWSVQELKELQNHRLRRLVQHAYDNVPYYRRVFDERRIRPADIRSSDDLYKLPVLPKRVLRENAEDLKARNIPEAAFTIGRTGGTTGIPLAFRLDKARLAFERAVLLRHWAWGGYAPGDRVVILRGLTLVPPGSSQRPWRHDIIDNRLYLSSFHMSAATMPLYAEKLLRWNARFIAGYPSSLRLLASYLRQVGLRIPTEAVFTSSEVLTPAERSLIEDRFSCTILDYYGSGERLVAIHQCEEAGYHESVEFGIAQIDSDRGEPVGAGESGEIVQTSLTNLSMPLIRYLSGDTGSRAQGVCACGRGLPLFGEIMGRKDDVIVTPDGRSMPQAGLDQIHEFVTNVEQCQLVQDRVGHVVVNVVPRPGFGASDVAVLRAQLGKRLGASIEIEVETVPALEVSATGKTQFIVSRIRPSQDQHN